MVDYSLYLVTDRSLTLGRSLEYIVEEAVKGGVTIVQLREKGCSSKEFYNFGVKLKKLLMPFQIPLIINDRLDIALACNADGIHIGQSDLPYEVVRKIMGKNKIIGLSVESLEDAINANEIDPDYIAVSPVFTTDTKLDTANALGLSGIKQIKEISKHPVLAIGGINAENAAEVKKAGADGLCVVSAIMSAPSPKQASHELKQIIKQNNS